MSEQVHLYGCPKCQTKTVYPIETKKCSKCRAKLVWLCDPRDMPDGKPNLELIRQLEKESEDILRCKGCGSTDFKILQSKAHRDYRSLFATVQACAKCGLMAYADNMIGHTAKSYEGWDEKPLRPEYVKMLVPKSIIVTEKSGAKE